MHGKDSSKSRWSPSLDGVGLVWLKRFGFSGKMSADDDD